MDENKAKDFLTSVNIHGTKIIPSDTFTIGGNKYILMDILQDLNTQVISLEIMGMRGKHAAQTATVGLLDFESMEQGGLEKFFESNKVK